MAAPRAEVPDMRDYGVGGPEWEPLPWSWAAERLVPARNYWVVTVSAAGAPHSMPVWGVWDDDEHRFAFSCSANARKARNLAANPAVAIATESTIECVSIQGTAAPVDDTARKERWVERYMEKYQPLSSELSADFLRSHLLVEVTPQRAYAVIEREDEFAERATRWVFEG